MNNYKKTLLVISVFSLIPVGQVIASEGSSRKLEEVLVTARKRSENIQETPVAVTAISGDELRAQGILSASDLSKSVPSLQINDGTAAQIFIRGIGQRAPMARFDPSVSVYLDGIFIPRPDGQLLDTIDVDNVQVLRGPQGTLFGKNNTGGALVFTLTKPSDTDDGYLEAALGNFSEQRIRGGINMPISDNFFTRLAVSSYRRDGFLIDESGSLNQSIDRQSLILQTRWLARDDVMVDTLAFFGRIRERYPSYNCKVANPDALFINGLGILWAGDTDPSNPHAYVDNCEANSRDQLADLQTNQGPGQRQTKDQDTLMLATTLDWELSENHTLKTIFGYRDSVKMGPQAVTDEGGPADYLRANVLGDSDQKSLTVELQLSGTLFAERVDYTAGVFWQYEYKSERFLTSSALVGAEAATFGALALGQAGVDLGPLNTLLSSLMIPGGTVPLVGGILPLATVHDFEIDGQTLAVFSQATWHISDDFELTIGGRYTQEQRESKLATSNADLEAMTNIVAANDPRFIPAVPSMGVLAFAGPWAQDPIQIASDILYEQFPGEIHAPLGEATLDSKDSTFSEFTPMTSAAWILPEAWLEGGLINSAMLYCTWSYGFKSGFQEPSGVDGLKVVDPEGLENREIGIKIDALEQSLRVNMALYSMTYEDMQLITVKVDSANSLIVTSQNAGESMVEGGELEIMWLPTANTLVSFSYSNNNYKFLEFQDQDMAALALRGEIVPVDRSDEDFAVSPSQMASLGIQHAITSNLGVFIPRLDISYKGDIYMGLDDGSWTVGKTDPDLVYIDAYTLLDLRLSWQNPDGDLSVAVYVKNATDKRYDIGSVATADTLGTFVTALGDPRLFGVELRKTF